MTNMLPSSIAEAPFNVKYVQTARTQIKNMCKYTNFCIEFLTSAKQLPTVLLAFELFL